MNQPLARCADGTQGGGIPRSTVLCCCSVCHALLDLSNSCWRCMASSVAMDLRQLAALVAVGETGTFSAAADRLHTVQSNVSTHVARLERELGVTLVDRAGGRLTEEGKAVVARARRVQGELDALTPDVASMRDEVIGGVRMGGSGTTRRGLVPPLVSAMP